MVVKDSARAVPRPTLIYNAALGYREELGAEKMECWTLWLGQHSGLRIEKFYLWFFPHKDGGRLGLGPQIV